MEEEILKILERIANALEQQNSFPKWDFIINIIPWLTALITIILLLKEKLESERPYLEISFELVRSTLVCLVIRNIGNKPARLKSMTFNDEFINQLSSKKVEILQSKKNMNVTIFPNRFWILPLDTNTHDVIKFKNSKLKIDYIYTPIKKNKKYRDSIEIDFKEYNSFLVYLSETDELKNMAEKKLTKITALCEDISKYMKQ